MAAAIRSRALTASAAVAAAFDRIEALDGTLMAFCTLARDEAFARAAAIDAGIARGGAVGPLAGVPIAVKDLIATRGLRTTFGSPLYADFVPDESDVVVDRLEAAGAIVLGKTNVSEFGYGPVGHNPLFPTTRNPWNPALTSGGSSAGTAAAVASGMVPFGLGSDGGGSIRIPAALCGVVGVKASWGRVPLYPGCRDERYPGASGWESLEHIGPLSRTVADAALALDVMAGPTALDRHSIPAESAAFRIAPPETLRGLTIAFSGDLGFAAVDPEVRRIATDAALRLAAALGCRIEAVDPPIPDPQSAFEAIVALDTDREGLRRMAGERDYRFGGALGRLLAHPWSADDFTAAILARKTIANAMSRFMARFDLLLTPTTAVAAFAIDCEGPERIDGRPVLPSAWTPFSSLANLTGQPAATVPAGFTAAGLPVGLQIMGRHLGDATVLTACAAVEQLLPWRDRVPPLAVCARSADA
ncbi:amidase [Hyphomicrobiaceae bacterium 22]|uniref:Amidase n=1 Tax=Prosthecodimorpha staleyi TaxID=2840188 RepID=A0A947D6A7_9HYPH|nr:amidase [Prosthecodimorpha staleyi]